jgi:hypothetical protein
MIKTTFIIIYLILIPFEMSAQKDITEKKRIEKAHYDSLLIATFSSTFFEKNIKFTGGGIVSGDLERSLSFQSWQYNNIEGDLLGISLNYAITFNDRTCIRINAKKGVFFLNADTINDSIENLPKRQYNFKISIEEATKILIRENKEIDLSKIALIFDKTKDKYFWQYTNLDIPISDEVWTEENEDMCLFTVNKYICHWCQGYSIDCETGKLEKYKTQNCKLQKE